MLCANISKMISINQTIYPWKDLFLNTIKFMKNYYKKLKMVHTRSTPFFRVSRNWSNGFRSAGVPFGSRSRCYYCKDIWSVNKAKVHLSRIGKYSKIQTL